MMNCHFGKERNITMKVKIKLIVGLVGCDIEEEYEIEDWEEMTDEEKEKECRVYMFDMIEWCYEEVEPEESNHENT